MNNSSIIRKLVKSQKGFTLIELIIAIAIAGIIGAAATMALNHMIVIPTISNESNTAINNVRNAVHWINKDVQGADPSTIDDSPTPPKFLSLEQNKWDDSTSTWSTHTIEYALENGEMWRSYDGSTPGTLIAQYIDQDNSSCTWDDTNNVLDVTIIAQVGDETETRTFEVKPRPD